MRAVRPLVVALATLVGGSACDRLPTEAPRPSAPSSQTAPTGLLSCSALPAESVTYRIGRTGKTITFGSPCVQPTVGLQAQHSNYAVAW